MSIETVVSIIFPLSELLLKLLKGIKITYRIGGINIEFEEEKTIDERIAKIDEARKSMVEAIVAIDELHKEAETNKAELNDALLTLSETEKNKNNLENELKNIRQLMQSDITTFKTLAGIPSQKEIKKERVLGFLLGVFASVIASGVVWGITSSWSLISGYITNL